MFRLSRPGDAMIDKFLGDQDASAYSYPDQGATRELSHPPSGFVVDRNRVRLGNGDGDFERACEALRRWEMFALGWVEICWPKEPIAPGGVVGILATTLRIWSLSACRIVYVIDEPARFGFAYGTLADHVGCGEERFLIERDEAGDIWYDLRAFSRPGHVLTRLGYPWMRTLQRRFARDSMARMKAQVGG